MRIRPVVFATLSFTCLVMVNCFLELDQDHQLSPSDVHALQIRLEEEKEKRILLQNDVEVLMGKFAAMEREITSIRTAQTSVAFTATLSTNTPLPKSGQRLIVDKVNTNIGGGYDGRHGFFKSPVNGTFLFIMTALNVETHYVHLEVMKNNTPIARLFCGDGSNPWAESATVSVVTSVTPQDEIWVREMDGASSGDVHGNGYTTFTGVLLQDL